MELNPVPTMGAYAGRSQPLFMNSYSCALLVLVQSGLDHLQGGECAAIEASVA